MNWTETTGYRSLEIVLTETDLSRLRAKYGNDSIGIKHKGYHRIKVQAHVLVAWEAADWSLDWPAIRVANKLEACHLCHTKNCLAQGHVRAGDTWFNNATDFCSAWTIQIDSKGRKFYAQCNHGCVRPGRRSKLPMYEYVASSSLVV